MNILNKQYDSVEEAKQAILTYPNQVCAYVARVCKYDHDLIQEVYCTILEKISQYNCKHKIGGWLYKIACNVVNKYYKLRKQPQIYNYGYQESPLQQLIEQEDVNIVVNSLESLSDRDSYIIRRHLVDKITLENIAKEVEDIGFQRVFQIVDMYRENMKFQLEGI
jgi:RNA polymerase sigma factor (sigma-70 family)